ncbi:C-type lectin domain family 2 member D3 [Cherax quadricarinatus]|uniref:C-type lectin domain family 2 member D3 n=1 Tax=Cherax quadricarinatus TaxID=27406 RepID=UPI00387EDD94
MKVLAVLLVAVVVCCGGRINSSSDCGSKFTEIARKCYSFIYNEENWEDARKMCQNEKAELASVVTMEQYYGLLKHINSTTPIQYWISGRKKSERWAWTPSGMPMERMWWGMIPETSSDLCAYLCSNTEKYWEAPCTSKHRFICQKNLKY